MFSLSFMTIYFSQELAKIHTGFRRDLAPQLAAQTPTYTHQVRSFLIS